MRAAFAAAMCLLSAVGAVASPAGAAEPDPGVMPGTRAPPERGPSLLGIRVVGEAGFGQATLPAVPSQEEPGGRYAALALALGFEGEGWVRPHLGVGMRVTSGFYAPFSSPSSLTNSYALIEPQILWRNGPLLFGPRKLIAASWRTSAGLGFASVHTDRACGKRCDVIYVRADRLSASVSTGALVSVGPVGIYVGLRFALDSSVDWSLPLNLGLGIEL